MITVATLVLSLVAMRSTASAAGAPSGVVYTLTNDVGQNAIQVYRRDADGSLLPPTTVNSGGAGTGTPLASQGAIAESGNGRRLFAVNAGSNSISSFRVTELGLLLADTEPSGGTTPISITTRDGVVYVLNAGGVGNISGFSVDRQGMLMPLAGSTRALSPAGGSPEQIGFTPAGGVLIVPLKGANVIDTFVVGHDGVAGPAIGHASAGAAPYGFDFDRHGRLLISEAASSAIASYRVGQDGSLTLLDELADGQQSACWVVASEDGRFAYTANAASGTVSTYRVSSGGDLSLVPAPDGLGSTGGKPLDLALSRGGRLLYVLNNGTHTINAFRVEADGGLTRLADTSGPAAGATGLLAN